MLASAQEAYRVGVMYPTRIKVPATRLMSLRSLRPHSFQLYPQDANTSSIPPSLAIQTVYWIWFQGLPDRSVHIDYTEIEPLLT
jgi:hypothetical protein